MKFKDSHLAKKLKQTQDKGDETFIFLISGRCLTTPILKFDQFTVVGKDHNTDEPIYIPMAQVSTIR